MAWRRGVWRVFRDAAGDGASGAGTGGGTPPAASGAGGAQPPAGGAGAGSTDASAGGAGGEGSLLSKAAGATGAAAPTGELAWLPEKYRVTAADGKLDLAASAQKLATGHADLEKHLGAKLTPATADDYKADAVLAKVKEKTGADVKLDDAQAKAFRDAAHKAGLSQAQYEFVLGEYFNQVQAMMDGAFDNAMAKGQAELVKLWGAPEAETFKGNMASAVRAFNAYAPQAVRTAQNMDAIGNHPVVLQVLAAVGRELKEDRRGPDEGGASDDINRLMNSEPYWNKNHPEHAATVAKVNGFFERGGKIERK